MPIPRLIHQTWKTEQVPSQWQASVTAYQKLPGFTYRLWTDADNYRFMKNYFPAFLSLYESYPHPIQRADMIRYFLLYQYGGVYSDLDLVPNEKFVAFFDMYQHCDVCLAGTKEGNGFSVKNYTNCFMMSQEKAAFWPIVWERLREPLARHTWKWFLASSSSYFQVLFTTGPGVICDAVEVVEETAATTTEDPVVTVVRIPAALIQPGVETDPPPVTRPEAVVSLLKGESWQQSDADIWRSGGRWLSWLPCIEITLLCVWLLFLSLWLSY